MKRFLCLGLPALAAAAALGGCATAAAPSDGVAPEVGSVRQVLQSCLGEDPSFCRGFIEASFDELYARKVICPPPIQSSDVEQVVVAALRKAPPDSPAIVHASAAIAHAWPCSGVPNGTVASGPSDPPVSVEARVSGAQSRPAASLPVRATGESPDGRATRPESTRL